LIDLDHFKEVNDSFGHQTGDVLLKQIGPRISAVIRPTDLVARLGGDEFAVILTGADGRFATSVAQRITDALCEPIEVDRASLHIGASIGVAVAPVHADTADELIRCADVAMYRAKGAKSAFDIYEAALDDGAERFRLIEDLRQALEDGSSLTLHYQPEIDLRTGQVVTVEALLRWPHPTLGMIPPEHLLNLAEENGMIRPLTDWVFHRAVTDCARWWRTGRPVAVAVNLLATDLLDASLPARVHEVLARAGLPPQALVLEITERMVMADLMRAKQVIGNLAALGVRVSIDDFGTGFSSLAYLSELAVGELKLDRMFTARLQAGETGGRDESIARSVIDLGHAVGLRVVAEGIERIEFIDLLAGLGCDIGQGFAIQAPRPAEEIDFDAIALGVRAQGGRTHLTR
ncbi:MAG TPA: bifunctional diguanylate cyclase/phosphodiesterase, partial [Acidimicrobiales bacterium]|nr:bifunctional diguanylate cyclase/phosphodiesterase [Acidimicrobiales bacterium]